jgi:hypothetical protein
MNFWSKHCNNSLLAVVDVVVEKLVRLKDLMQNQVNI